MAVLKQLRFVPRKEEDFGDGGAFPEIHVAQYPLDMGRDKLSRPGTRTLPVTVDANGKLAYDAIVKQNENSRKLVYSQHKDLVPKILKNEDEEMVQMGEELLKEIEETAEATKAALEQIVNAKLNTAQPKSMHKQSDSIFIKYKPSHKSAAFNSGAEERIIRMVEMQVDPFEPPKFKHKSVPRPSGSPPVPVLHSPPRPVSVKDRENWKIQPCISNWKNAKGYVIPLDKRLSADGTCLVDNKINEKFGMLREALHVAETAAREEVNIRTKVLKELEMHEREKKNEDLRALAQKARLERAGAAPLAADKTSTDADTRGDYEPPMETREEREGRLKRDTFREERRHEREGERRLEANDTAMRKKSKITRDRDRDISEKVALGMASTRAGREGEVMYDQRLFNQEKGMDSGFATDDLYNVYSKGLFTAQPTLSTLYRPKKDVDNEMYGGAEEQLDKIMKTERFKPNKGFGGTAERAAQRDGPVEFEKTAEDTDPFGLDKILVRVTGKKAMDNVATGGMMRASAGSSMRDGYEGASSRTRIGFERGC